MVATAAPHRPRTLLPALAGLAAALLGLVCLGYALVLRHELDGELLPIPEHVPWMLWLGSLLLVAGGGLAAVVLARQALAR